ncbi:MAG: hypothetical protein ACRCU2_04765 [Planktothrix sp.]
MNTSTSTENSTQKLSEIEAAIPPSINLKDFLNVVEIEVDMDFMSNLFFDSASGCGERGCQRVQYCSCDCNHCSFF